MKNLNDRIGFKVENHIAHVQLQRPEKMNALDQAMFAALELVLEKISADSSIRVVVLSGAGDAFCAGLDMSNFSGLLNPDTSADTLQSTLATRTHGIANQVQHVVWGWRELAVPVIAAVHGVSVGGGLQIALAADMRYAQPGTRMSIMELKWGLIPDMSCTQLMRHLMPEDVVRELTYTARVIDAEEAAKYALVTKVVDDPLDHALQIAERIAARNPDAIKAAKRVLNEANYLSAEQGLLMESVEQDAIIGSANQLEAVMAELQKRPPQFKD